MSILLPLKDPKDVRSDANAELSDQQKADMDEGKFSLEDYLKIYSSLIFVLIGIILIGFGTYCFGEFLIGQVLKQVGTTCVISGLTYWIFQNVFQKGNKVYTKQAIDNAIKGLGNSLATFSSQLGNIQEQNTVLTNSFSSSNHVLSGAFKSNLVQIYSRRNEGLNDIIEDMKSSKSINIIGISLRDYFSPYGNYFVQMGEILKDIATSNAHGGIDSCNDNSLANKRDIRILIINPFCEQATIRAERESDEEYFSAENPYEKSGLYSDVWQTIRYLDKVTNHHNGINAKLYNSSPSCFLVITDKYTYIEQYHYGVRRSGLVGGTYPLLKFANDNISDPNKELEATVTNHLKGHFDYMWDEKSVRAKPISYALHEFNIGTSISAWECGVNNIFRSRSNAQQRISCLISKEINEIKLIGISLRDFLHAGNEYYRIIRELLIGPSDEKTLSLKVLLLDPLSEQGILRSQREEPHVIRGNLYSEVMTSIRSIERLRQHGANIEAKLYSTSTNCFCVITSESTFVEQYHYGSSEREGTILGGKVPIIEFNGKSSCHKELSGNFDFIWDHPSSKSLDEWLSQNTDSELMSQIVNHIGEDSTFATNNAGV